MIELTMVSKSYGRHRALDEVSFRAPDGAVTGLVGQNGAGKSTLLRIISALTVPDAGHVTVDGSRFAESRDPAAALGVFLSAEWIPATMTAGSFLRYLCDLQSLPGGRADEAIELVGLAHAGRRRVRTYSLGMRQRLGIAAAIIGRPRNLVLDEPINGLDPDAIARLRTHVREVARAGGSVLLSSHHMSELTQVADHIVMIEGGRVVRSGPMTSFVATDMTRTYLETDDLDSAVQVLSRHGYVTEPHGSGLIVLEAEPADVGRLLFGEGPGLSHLRRFERSLEETYFDEIAARAAEGVR